MPLAVLAKKSATALAPALAKRAFLVLGGGTPYFAEPFPVYRPHGNTANLRLYRATVRETAYHSIAGILLASNGLHRRAMV